MQNKNTNWNVVCERCGTKVLFENCENWYNPETGEFERIQGYCKKCRRITRVKLVFNKPIKK